MNTRILTALGAVAAIALPTAASAQATPGEGFVGVSVGLHDLGADDDDLDDLGVDIDDNAFIYGVYAGYDFPVSENFFAGVEGNFHLGDGPIDSEYGASVRLGFRSEGGAKFYARGGYQEVDLDLEGLTGIDLDGIDVSDIDDSDGDYLVGLGVDFPAGDRSSFRVNLDTIGFDTLRATAGVALRF